MNGPEHGRYTTYTNHRCRCEPCRSAWAAFGKRRRAQRAARGEVTAAHGNSNTYSNWGCRCTECAAAHAAELRRWRARKALAS